MTNQLDSVSNLDHLLECFAAKSEEMADAAPKTHAGDQVNQP